MNIFYFHGEKVMIVETYSILKFLILVSRGIEGVWEDIGVWEDVDVEDDDEEFVIEKVLGKKFHV